MARIVISVGGNALGLTPAEQLEHMRRVAEGIAELVAAGHEIVVSHGNGPQVGQIELAFEKGALVDPDVPPMPLAECTGLSQGYIGYHLQQELQRALRGAGSDVSAVTTVTQVEVDEADPGFAHPTKPIGPFYDEAQAAALKTAHPDRVYQEDAGRGWRRYVASPRPLDIVEKKSILKLVESGQVVIACGGGGIPVVRDGAGHRGVPAVIDKDRASAKLASLLKADMLVILTAVDHVALNFGTDSETQLGQLSPAELASHLADGHFAEGSMKPKVEAVLDFVFEAPQRTSVITGLENVLPAVAGRAGTRISS